MKSESQIKQKLKQVIFRHRKSYVADGLAKAPKNCAHNRRITLPVHTGNRASIGICGDPSIPLTCVCDSTMGGDLQAQECPYFSKLHTAQGLKEEFTTKLGLDGTLVQIGFIAKEYPDVAALMWALGPGKNVDKKPPEDSEDAGILAFFGDQEDEPDNIPERPLVEDEDER